MVSKSDKENIITKEVVEHIGKLIMTELSDEEVMIFTPQLKDILDYVEKLDKIDTKNVKETHHVTGLANILRKDEVGDSFSQEEALSNAYDTEDGYFKAPGKLSLG